MISSDKRKLVEMVCAVLLQWPVLLWHFSLLLPDRQNFWECFRCALYLQAVTWCEISRLLRQLVHHIKSLTNLPCQVHNRRNRAHSLCLTHIQYSHTHAHALSLTHLILSFISECPFSPSLLHYWPFEMQNAVLDVTACSGVICSIESISE